ncbi:UDP-N-acetylmuramoyl-L-alanine--D-glutamate ligase [Methylovirgula sp. 4M-Z18]|uniref:UDP-N-acetylmuramoyl-L-alanine--D-glutamate ligase n=1 Tax=Methylovirgula sp. 4M-Z18 TaxID=2293567 RepID=UPI000E2EBBB9|nr:UDP-N-acetylmuramoyl-L-alanine--D-glutamate ligase [Methylovirgula sp. 4M-Z18]RFB79613.1 UDP-N-acetylmuramoyl-L-alanine--D-glutamate ligase [Methylovirgula sp. 4M-Z18]
MTPVSTFADRHVALFGLGGSGLATAEALVAGGARVTAWDDAEAAREKAAEKGITIADLKQADWSEFAALILAPGVPLTHPKPHWTVERAHAAHVEIIGDIELFCRERARIAPQAPFIAITGTNGKSTTTALIAHLLRSAGRDVQMGGNIGTAILSLEPPAENRVHVIECSSFQIDLAPSLNPSVGVLLNITPDHLDRHGTIEHYAKIKERLVQGADIAFIGVDDELTWAIGDRNQWRSYRDPDRNNCPISAERELEWGLYLSGSKIVSKRDFGSETVLADLTGIGTLRGRHNGQNALFAAGVAQELGLSPEEIQQGLASFPGLAHRMEPVGQLGTVLFVNDSKATNADAAEKALKSFEHIYWIAGGKSKEGGIASLEPLFGRIAKTYLIGAATDEFAATLQGKVPFEKCGMLDRAVRRATQDAAQSLAAESVVLLSPACASYDQYPNFEVRGDRFRDLVRDILDEAERRNAEQLTI